MSVALASALAEALKPKPATLMIDVPQLSEGGAHAMPSCLEHKSSRGADNVACNARSFDKQNLGGRDAVRARRLVVLVEEARVGLTVFL